MKSVDPEKMHTELRVATDKFFLNGGKDENFLPEIKDVGEYEFSNDNQFKLEKNTRGATSDNRGSKERTGRSKHNDLGFAA